MALTIEQLAERGLVRGARVVLVPGEPFERKLGTILDVPGELLISVAWDNGTFSLEPERNLGVFGVVLPESEVRKIDRPKVRHAR